MLKIRAAQLILPQQQPQRSQEMLLRITDDIPETQAGVMLLNNSSDNEVIVGASPGDPLELDDTLLGILNALTESITITTGEGRRVASNQ